MAIYCAHQGSGQAEESNQLWLNWYDPANEPPWAADTHVRDAGVSTSPALASFGGVWCARNVNNTILVDVYDPATKTWAGDTQVEGSWIAQSPALGVAPGNRLVCLYQALGIGEEEGSDTGLLWCSYYAGTWSEPFNAITGTTGSAPVMTLSPTLCVFGQTLYCLFQGPAFDGNLWYTTSPDGISWVKPQQAKTASGDAVRLSAAPAAIATATTLYCFMEGVGSSGELCYATTTDGATWTASTQVVPQGGGNVEMSDSPAAVLFGSTIYVFYHSTIGDMFDSALAYVTTADGKTWGKQAAVPTKVRMTGSPAACVF